VERLLISIGALWIGAALAQAPASTLIPIEDFTRHDEFGTVKISPDGEYIAFTTGRYGRSVLVSVSLKDTKVQGGVRTPNDDLEIDDFHWVSDTRLIYLLAERQPGLVQPVPTGEIFAFDRDGSNRRMLYGFRAGDEHTGSRLARRVSSYATPELISTLPQDPKHILIAEHPWREKPDGWYFDRDARPVITRLDVYSGDKQPLETAPLRNATILTDRAHHARFAVGLNEAFEFAVGWKPQPEGPWTDFKLPGFREEGVWPQRFSSDNHSVLFAGVREGESIAALYRLDLQTQAVEKMFAFDGGDIDGLITDFADDKVVGVSGYGDRPSTHWLAPDDPAASLHRGLQRAFSDASVTVTSTTRDGRLAIVFVSSDVDPGVYYLFDTVTKKADLLRTTREWVDPRRMRPKRPIQLAASDGLQLHGYVTQPAGEGPHPLVVLPHGGPHGVRDTWEYDWEVQLLASRGYAVLQVNFRGSGGYGMDFEKAGFRQWGARMQDDITDATRWAIGNGIARADRICIFGSSYGGYAALMGAVREPKLYRCAIGQAGVYDLELMLSSADIPRSRSGQTYLSLALGSDIEQLRSRSPAYNAERIEVPVLLVHGKADGRADYEQARRMKAALEKHKKPVEWLALSREGHGAYDDDTRREVYERILAFLDRHLKIDAAPAPAASN
jgi:dipeptidyl aminopeptidase/acylaminoacyl peptidase